MATLKLISATGGSASVQPPNLTSDITLTTPSSTGTLVTASDVGTLLQISIGADYSITASDIGKQIYHQSADTTARTVTIPINLPVGTTFLFVNDTGAGSLSIASADTLMLAGTGTTGSPRTLASNGMATAVKITTSKWIINGAGLT